MPARRALPYGVVLSVARVTDRTGSYYLSDLALELGPAEGSRLEAAPAGRWVGRAAGGLALRGPVGSEDLAAILEGRRPGSGQQLADRRRVTVSSFDLTFSAPKSVSVLFALADPDVAGRVLTSHHRAVDAALAYVEDHAVAVRRQQGEERSLLPTGGVVASAFCHGVSRALDPHLHTHVVVANLARGSDGRWSAVDGRGLYAHADAAGSLYEAHLRQELTARIGVEWGDRPGARREIAGLDPVVLAAFSNRSAEIRAHMAERSLRSGRAARVAWAATRDPKPREVSPADLRAEWQDRAAACGLGGHAVAMVLGRTEAARRPAALDEAKFAASVLGAGAGGVTRREVVAAWADAVLPGASAGNVLGAVDHWLRPDDGAVGVAEREHAPRAVVPARQVVEVIGPRPARASDQPVWHRAADAVEAYRTRWGRDERNRSELSPLHLADRVDVDRQVAEARRMLGRDPRAMSEPELFRSR